MTIYEKDASIVIPTYNRAELLEFTLLSLYEQSIPAHKFEVIVVNDNSTDSTEKVLKKIKPPYELRSLYNEVNSGAAHSRNRGIKAAKGKTIIFLDEMLVDKDFVKEHLKYHEKEKMVVTTHCNGEKIFSHYYSNFSRKQKQKCKKTSMKASTTRKPTPKKGVVRLLSKEEVINHTAFRYGYKIKSWYDPLQDIYGENLEKMAAPWFLFITNGVSVSRTLLDEAGLFDEKLVTWMEDWELGYRLYLAGATFYNAKEIACYHQNHPVGRDIRYKLKHYLYFLEKHPITEVVLAPSISAVFHWSVTKLGKVLTQYRELETSNGDDFKEFIQAFRDLAETFRWHLQEMLNDKDLSMLNSYKRGLKRWREPIFQRKVINQLEKLEQDPMLAENYSDLINGFKEMLHLPVKKL